MEFRRLRASIAHNEQEAPSIYMAICAIESLVYDIEDEADQDISACPIGDETLPTKLAWLCNTVLDIYHDNCEEMTRNRDRLSSAVEKLRKVEGELIQLADVSDQLDQVRRKLDVRQRELDEAKENKRLFDSLHAKCAEAEETLKTLKEFDVEKEQQRFQQLDSEISGYVDAQAELRVQLDEANIKLHEAKEAHDALEKELAVVRAKTLDLGESVQPMLDALAQEREAGAQAAARVAELEENKKRLVLDKDRQLALIQQAQTEIDNYTEQVLEPIRQQIIGEQERLEQLEKEKQQEAAALETICQKRDAVINQIAEIREREKEENAERLKKEQQLMELTADQKKRRADITALQEELDTLTEELSALQDLVFELDKQKIPTQKKRVEEESAQTAELETELQMLKDREEALQREREEIESKCHDASEKLKTFQDLYDTLTADYSSQNSELQNLEKKLNDMKDKTDVQKHALYKTQLEESIREVQQIQDECDTMEAELQSTRAQLEEKRSRYGNLKNQKDKAAKVEEEINRYLAELEPIVTQGFLAQLEEMEERLNQLSYVRNNLHKSLAMMGEILGEVPVPDDGVMLLQLHDIMQRMQSKIKQMRNDVAMCAKSVKLEER